MQLRIVKKGNKMATKIQIEEQAKHFAKKRQVLSDLVTELNDQIQRLQRQSLKAIKHALNETVAEQAKLNDLLVASPELFVKPRTMICHGMKVGYGKQKGKIEVADEDKTIKLIRKVFPEMAEQLIITKETVSKDAVGKLPVYGAKRIGVTILQDTDAVIIKPTDSEVDKLVAALLKEKIDEVTA